MTSPPAPVIAALIALAPVLIASEPAAVAAEGASTRSPEELYVAGKAALEAGRFDAALEAFEAALRTVDDEVTRWQLLLGVAVAHELSGRPLEALEHYRAFVERAAGSLLARTPKWAERLDVARRSAASAEAEVLQTRGMLIVEGGAPFAATVLSGADGDEALTLPARRYLAPGAYRVHATALGMAPFSQLVEVHVGDRRRVEVTLAPVAVIDPGAGKGSDDDAGAWVPIVAGGALLATGAVMTGLAYSDALEVERLSNSPGTPEVLREHARLTERGEDRQTASWICYGAGAVAVGAGVLWMLLADDAPAGEASVAPYGVRVGVDAHGAAAVVGGRF